jgi:hypothetical protein
MSTRPENFSRAGIVLIEDPAEDQLMSVNDWLAALEDEETG